MSNSRSFGYRGFHVWQDANGWSCRRLLTGDEYEIEGCASEADAKAAIDVLVDAWVGASEPFINMEGVIKP